MDTCMPVRFVSTYKSAASPLEVFPNGRFSIPNFSFEDPGTTRTRNNAADKTSMCHVQGIICPPKGSLSQTLPGPTSGPHESHGVNYRPGHLDSTREQSRSTRSLPEPAQTGNVIAYMANWTGLYHTNGGIFLECGCRSELTSHEYRRSCQTSEGLNRDSLANHKP